MASSHSVLLKSLSDESPPDQTQKLEEFMSRLQQERLKIEAFKRELPLCMHLLTNAMEESKRQLQSCKASEPPRPPPPPPVLEQFLPTDNIVSNSSEKVHKSHWMTSVQLWNPPSAMGFLPFDANYQQKAPPPELAVAAVSQESSVKIKCSDQTPVDSHEARKESNACRINQANRKARRCWSPDLHRRFLNALHILGGSQVATPKQIRELMKVDGLTNDEVKSHLQKYRLHTRRPSSSSMAADGGASPTPLVVLGGIWVPPEYAAPPMIYTPHPTMHASSHYCVSTAAPTQEFYPVATAASCHRQLMHQFHVCKASSPHGSLDSDIKPAADGRGGKSESTEDGKSDSSYEGERERLAAMRVAEGEESHVSEITLKFKG